MTEMPELIVEPELIPLDSGATLEEYVGRLRTGTDSVSVAMVSASAGWSGPTQCPAFDEICVVLSGTLLVEHDGETIKVTVGQAVIVRAGETIQYSSEEGAQYLAVCLPAYDAALANRAERSTTVG
jgi:ethanolamine utilization protein EutQ (cupin superfamily)